MVLKKLILASLLIGALSTICVAFFSTRKRILLPTRAQTITIGDVNSDGFPDLIVGRWPDPESGPNFSVLLGRGNGEFPRDTRVPFTGGPYISDIKLGYFNNDKYLDIAISRNNSTTPGAPDNFLLLSTLMGSGSGGFGQEQLFFFSGPGGESFTSHELLTGDYDLDGKVDLYLVAGRGGGLGGIFPLKNTGKGLQSVGVQYFGLETFGIAGSDFNGDGKPDVVLASSRGSIIGYGQADMGFGSFENHDPSRLQQSVVTGDFNNDGRVDYVVSDSGRSELRMFLNNGDGFTPLPKIYSVKGGINSSIKGLITADFNGDGNLDVAFSLFRAGQIKFMYGNGEGNFFPAGYISTGAFTAYLAAGDLNGDGLVDLVAANDENSPAEQVDVFMNSPDVVPNVTSKPNLPKIRGQVIYE